ncbi:hypothetical protein FRZ61_24510 [Hypericibacter adhaerens]|uniref:Uncharacterized protein n=1 Tax=Hypericibacter adhaerens TaxID=2602016 RepID=A0A5J6MY80_9PROT|nr:hypothetical protein [Hypericibacter adhaerens]QEX22519.1 hypothetical protein FRZ61_24510 [Hypericibacter adhaerens]
MRAFPIAALLLLVSPAAHALDAFTVGNWKGDARYDESGSFVRCSMTTEFMTGEFVTFSNAKDGSFVMSVTDKHAALTRGEAESAEIVVGEYPPLPALLTNYDANTAGMTFDNPGPIYQRLREGTRITINPARGQSMVYPLSQVNRGLQRLLACTMREMGFANYGSQAVGDPFGAGLPVPQDGITTQATPHGPTSTAQFHPMDPAALAALADKLLGQAGLAQAKRLDPAERAKLAPGFPLFWTDSERTGGGLVAYELPGGHAPMPLLVGMAGTLTLFNDAAGCPGLFDSRIEDLTAKAGFPARRLHTICRRANSANAYVADYIILAPDPGRLVKLAVAVKGLQKTETDSVVPHSDALLTAALQTLKGVPGQ